MIGGGVEWLHSRRIRTADGGAKAANLARLAALGLDVPPGFVLSGRHYRDHLRRAGVHDACDRLLLALPTLDAAALTAESAAIRDAIRQTPIDPVLSAAVQAILGAAWRWPAAVRSSAIAEDSAQTSFAGQLDSVLNVASPAMLPDAIRSVWASAWSERCLRYAQHAGTAPGSVGVIVQQQVDACHSGVLFTRDPLGNRDAGVIEWIDGLGDALVSGQVSPQRAIIRYPGLQVETTVASDAPAPSADQLRRLAANGLELERRLGGAQDIEWSIDRGGRLWLLQARPAKILTQAVHTTWSNANIAENFPDRVTPFLFSVVSRGYTAYFRNLGLGFGISRRRIEAMDSDLKRLVGLHAGRLYYNLSAIHAAIRQAPGGAQLAEWFNHFTGATEYPASRIIESGPLTRALEWSRVALNVTRQYLLVQRRVAAFEARADHYAARTVPAGIPQRSAAMLRDDLAAFMDIRLNRWNDAALADVAAMVCYGLLKRSLPAMDDRTNTALQNDLLKGMPDLASARPVAALWALAGELRTDPVLAAAFPALPAEAALALLQRPEHAALHEKFTGYLDRWGFRYSRELMLTSPTPQEDPIPMIRILQSYLRDSGPGPEAVVRDQAMSRIVATRRLEAQLSPSALLRWLPVSRAGRFRLLLHATHGAIRLRERARMKQALLYTRLRHVMLGIGVALEDRGHLSNRDDVFFLSVDEVLGLLDGEGDSVELRAAITQRRNDFSACASLQPPDNLHLPAGETWRPTETPADRGVTDAAGPLRGVSACGGRFEGAAAVVEHVADIDQIKNGDVLVTRQTDPGWAAVFFLIKGLVIERGGMLSHGAIIAREYGIPAVVGVPDAMRRIRNGERIRVNGDLGVVETGL